MKKFILCALTLAGLSVVSAVSETAPVYRSPIDILASADGKILYVAEKTAQRISLIHPGAHKVISSIPLPAEPTGLALAPDESILFAACPDPAPRIVAIDVNTQSIAYTLKAGNGVCSPVISNDGKRLYTCNRFDNDIGVIDLNTLTEITRIPVVREPVSAALTPCGRYLLAANHLPDGPSTALSISAKVSVIDTLSLRVIKEIPLPNGSVNVREIAIAPCGKYACVTHVLARYQLPTFQLDRGWMNTNALSIIDLTTQTLLNTVLVDDIDRGAANPWGVSFANDGKTICVTHAGTHELSVIDASALISKLNKLPKDSSAIQPLDYSNAPTSMTASDVPNDLSFLVDIRRRVRLPGKGPRALAVVNCNVYTTNYYSDDLNVVDIRPGSRMRPETISLGPKKEIDSIRQGEIYFNDAGLCFQGWQSCASCHPDGRADGLNWDLLNDGVGNPKNTKSLLLSHETPPSMGTGVRLTAEMAVRSGIKHILFMVRPEEDAIAIDDYLKSMRAAPSPTQNSACYQEAIARGKELFHRDDVGCASCHSGPAYTDLNSYNVGTRGELDRQNAFDTPTLIEIWRTAPYLHDGRSGTLRDILTTNNPRDEHGKTSHLTPREITDLEEYLLSL